MCLLCVCSWALSCVCLAELRDCRVLPAAQPQQEDSALVLDHQEDPTEDLLCGGGSWLSQGSLVALCSKGRLKKSQSSETTAQTVIRQG